MGNDLGNRIRNVTAVLGPTNTGKTHLAIERMLGHSTGMIGLPLRLLAREVFDKVVARVGAHNVALITGEEKIKPERPRYWVCTVEAMPRDIETDFLAIDEIQLCGDPDRGHVFTDRLLHARGREETLVLGAQTMRETIEGLIPGSNFISRPRLSKLSYAGEKKMTRLPPRSAIIAFSASEVYAIAELIRRQRGGTAVVLGSLSPRTRNAQVALYQTGQVEYLVATDAVGMGLNLNLEHVAFSATRKFDGVHHRNLTAGEMGQIAGRAGRYMTDGTFGVTGSADGLEPGLVEQLENHSFESVRVLQWRNRKLDFGTLDRLRDSLRAVPGDARLSRVRMAEDVLALETLSGEGSVREYASTPAAVTRLWELCQIPDYRKISAANHAELIGSLYTFLMGPEKYVPEDWFAKQVAFADRTDGDIDTIANRIAHIRTWTFVANRSDWLKDPVHWQERTRAIEDSLSDALHERLTQRFVDARTSALMKSMRDNEELTADISDDGEVKVENHSIGRLKGFSFWPDTSAEGDNGKAARHAAQVVVVRELGMRARRVAAAKTDAFKLTKAARILWRDDEIGYLEVSADPLKPTVMLITDEHMAATDKEKVQVRLDAWLLEIVGDRLKPLVELTKAEDVTGLARGIAFQMTENLGALKRETIADDIKSLDQSARAVLRKYGVRFGAFNIFFPLMLKPAAAELALTLWILKHGTKAGLDPKDLPAPPRAGLTSAAADPKIHDGYYRANGFHVCGPRAVRLDILERLADQIRVLVAWRATPNSTAIPPKGATGEGSFRAMPDMMSVLGCSPDELAEVLKALGFRSEKRRVVATPASVAPVTVAPAAGDSPADEDAVPAGVAALATVEAVVDAPIAPVLSEEKSVPEAVSEAAAVGSVDAAPVVVAEVINDVFEDVWRPKRWRDDHPRENRDQRQNRYGGQRNRDQTVQRDKPRLADALPGDGNKNGAAAVVTGADGAVANERPNRGRGREDRPGGGGSHRDQRTDRPAGGRPAHAATPAADGRQPNGNAGKRRDNNRPSGGDRGGERSQPWRGSSGGGDRDRGRKEGPPPSRMLSAAPPKKASSSVADSPFAALVALREQLSKPGASPGKKEKSS
jgi:ATP-dependent RNA helicase SUPV3L1/SUV3